MLQTAVNFDSIQISKFNAQSSKSPFESRSKGSLSNNSKKSLDFSASF